MTAQMQHSVLGQQSTVGRSHGEFTRWRDRTAESRHDLPSHERNSPSDELPLALSDLYANQTRWLFASVRNRIELLERCITSVASAARNWVDVAAEIKHIPIDNPCRAEEVLAGPVVAMRYLRLLLRNLRATDSGQLNPLPGRPAQSSDGRWHVPVLPITRELFDPICFVNFQANVWLKPGLCEEAAIAATTPAENRVPSTSLILGAGNVTGIVAADLLGRLFQDQHVALVKLHPLTDPLRPVLEQAFAPLIEAGCLRLISGDAAVGTRAIEHELVDAVHITGSTAAHDSIVWGADSNDRLRRKQSGDPLLNKPITSELGNVTPWIVIPGKYSAGQLQAQAENVAASIVNNVGFNCLATRVLVTCKQWPQREDFLSRLQSILSRLPRRVAYYPGAVDRFERFTGCHLAGLRGSAAHAGDEVAELDAASYADNPRLPWTLFRDVNPKAAPLFCREESFAPICAEIPLDASDEFDFLNQATEFANEQLWGTLCATLTVPVAFRHTERGRREFQAALTRLRYGTICINQWSGIAFALLTLPWGGHPSSTILDPQSGIGFVHNSFGLQEVEKSVLEGPIVVVPKPIWTPGHRQAERIAWNLFNLYHEPSLRHVAELSYSAIASLFTSN